MRRKKQIENDASDQISPCGLRLSGVRYVYAMLAILGAMAAAVCVQDLLVDPHVGNLSAPPALRHHVLWIAGIVAAATCASLTLGSYMALRAAQRSLRDQFMQLCDCRAALHQMKSKLDHLAHQDFLTGLPNRAFLLTYLEALNSERQSIGRTVLIVGLDRFGVATDLAGRDDGDALLIAVGRALGTCIDEDHLVARVSDDEFVIVSNEPPTQIVNRVRATLAKPFTIKGRRISINANIGYREMDTNDHTPMTTLADVSLALHHAKKQGENNALRFSQSMRDDMNDFFRLQNELGNAIKQGQIEPWFQPQVRLSDGQLHGVEVLARWRHPSKGVLTPDRFLPAAKRAGLIIDMDHTIWRTAMAHAVLWQKELLWRPCLSLNAAPDTISDPHLIERFLMELRNSGLDANQIIIEILETTLINGSDDMAAINIDSLSESGIGIELDDFGTEYASLSRLTQLPLNGIKLDRSLVAPLPDAAADSVVRAILALATELGLHVIAEGVEDDVQAKHLNFRGCTIAQGYGYARPMPAAEFRNWLAIHASRPVHAIAEIAQQA